MTWSPPDRMPRMPYGPLLICLLFFGTLDAQEMPAGPVDTTMIMTRPARNTEPVFLVRPLDELLEAALKHSPLLKAQDLRIDNLSEQLKLLRRHWSDFVFLDAAYQYGNGAWFDNIQTTLEDRSQVLTRENSFYRAGIAVRLPFGDFFSRKPRTQMLRNQIQEEKYNRQESERRVREAVIQYYQQLMLNIELVDVKSEEVEFHEIAVKLAEQYFRQGDLELSEFSRVIVERSRADESLRRAENEAKLSMLFLQELVGTEVLR